MPPSVTYWTGTWDPAKEAISKEINMLRIGTRAKAPVVAFSPGNRNRARWCDRVLTLSSGSSIGLRAAAALVEPWGDITHIFGGMSSWHLFRALGRRAIVLTAVDSRHPVRGLPNAAVARVVVESEADIDEWLNTGLPRDCVELIPPGVDCDWYLPSPPTSNRFTLLFASTPADPAEIESRGLPLLIALARLRPEIDILVPWRNWGNVEGARRAIEALRPPDNIQIKVADEPDMRPYFARAHATVLPYSRGAGKTSPNFVLEGLAAGRPCVTTFESGLVGPVSRARAGIVVNRDVASLSSAVDQVRANWLSLSQQARALAESDFNLRTFRARSEALYDSMTTNAGAQSQRAAGSVSTPS